MTQRHPPLTGTAANHGKGIRAIQVPATCWAACGLPQRPVPQDPAELELAGSLRRESCMQAELVWLGGAGLVRRGSRLAWLGVWARRERVVVRTTASGGGRGCLARDAVARALLCPCAWTNPNPYQTLASSTQQSEFQNPDTPAMSKTTLGLIAAASAATGAAATALFFSSKKPAAAAVPPAVATASTRAVPSGMRMALADSPVDPAGLFQYGW